MPIDFKTYLDDLNKTASRKYSAKEILGIMPKSEFTNIPDDETEESQAGELTPVSPASHFDNFVAKHPDRDLEILKEGFSAIQERVKNKDGIKYGEPITADYLEELGRERIKQQAPGLFKEGLRSLARGAIDLPGMAGKGMQWLDPDGGNETISDMGKKLEMFSTETQAKYEPSIGISKQAEISPWYSPRHMIARGPESMVASLAPFATGLAAGAVAGPVAGAAAGLATLGGLFYGGAAEDKYRQAKESGLSDEDAKSLANWEGGIEAGGELIADLIPLRLFKFAPKDLQKGLIRSVTAKTGIKDTLKAIGNTMVAETATEVGQAMGQTYASNQYGVDAGRMLDNSLDVIGPTIFMSLIFGGAGAAHTARMNQNKTKIVKALSDPASTQEDFDNSLREVAQAAQSIDPKAAKQFTEFAVKKREQGQPVIIGDDSLYAPAKQNLAQWLQTGQRNGQEFTPVEADQFIREKLSTGEFTDDDLQSIKEEIPAVRDIVIKIDAERITERAKELSGLTFQMADNWNKIQQDSIKAEETEFDQEWNQRAGEGERRKKQAKELEKQKQRNIEYKEKVQNDPTFKARKKTDAIIDQITSLDDRAMDGNKISKEERAIDLMLEQSRNTQTRSNFVDDTTGQRVQVPADSPAWMKEITTPSGLARKDIETLTKKYKEQILEGKPDPKNPITEKQWGQLNSVIIPAIDKVKRDHADEFFDPSDYEAEGYKFVKADIPILALDFNPGDTLLGFNGISGESEVIEKNDDSIVIKTPDNKTHTVGEWDGINITAFKEGSGTPKQPQGYIPDKKVVPEAERDQDIAKLKERESKLIGEIKNATDEDIIKKKEERLTKLQSFIDKAQNTPTPDTMDEMPTIEGMRHKMQGYRQREQEIQSKIDSAKDVKTKEHLNKRLETVQGKIAEIEPQAPAVKDGYVETFRKTGSSKINYQAKIIGEEPKSFNSEEDAHNYLVTQGISNPERFQNVYRGDTVSNDGDASKVNVWNGEDGKIHYQREGESISRKVDSIAELDNLMDSRYFNWHDVKEEKLKGLSKTEGDITYDIQDKNIFALKSIAKQEGIDTSAFSNQITKQELINAIREKRKLTPQIRENLTNQAGIVEDSKVPFESDARTKSKDLDDARKDFIDKKILEAGSIKAVQAKYSDDAVVDNYARERAGEIFGEAESTPNKSGNTESQQPTEEPQAKEVWEMTEQEYIDKDVNNISDVNYIRDDHYAIVKKALQDRKPVPESVLKDYPNLAKYRTAQKETPEAEPALEPAANNGLLKPIHEGYSDKFKDGWDSIYDKSKDNGVSSGVAARKSFEAVSWLFNEGYITKKQKKPSVSRKKQIFTRGAQTKSNSYQALVKR